MNRYYLSFEDNNKHIYQEYPMFGKDITEFYFNRFVNKIGRNGNMEMYKNGNKSYTLDKKKISMFVIGDLTEDFYDDDLKWFTED